MADDQDLAGPPSDDYVLLFEDAFEGNQLQMEHWQYRTDERFGGVNLPENVRVEDGMLHIDLLKKQIDGKDRYTSGGVISVPCFGYGYYEVKSKLWGGGPGLHSSFWLMGRDNTNSTTQPRYNQVIEIDGYEMDSHNPTSLRANVHYYIGKKFEFGGTEGLPRPKINGSKDFFVFGFEWLPNQINWYLNGKRIYQSKNPRFYAPQPVWLTALATPNGFAGGGKIQDQTLPGVSSWQYFRFYARDLVGVNLLGNPDFEFNTISNLAKPQQRDTHFPVAWSVEGDHEAGVVVDGSQGKNDGQSYLRHAADKPYQITTRQTLQYIPNGRYTLTAKVRSSGGQRQAELSIDGLGSLSRHTDLTSPVIESWRKVVIDDIAIENHQCSVSIRSDADAGQWLEVDDVQLFMSQGHDNIDLAPFPVDPLNTEHYVGEIVIDSQDVQTDGKWSDSSISGYLGKSFYSMDRQASAQWNARVPKAGRYRVLFHNLENSNNLAQVQLQVTHAQGVSTLPVDHFGMDRLWVDLGTYSFTPDAIANVRLSPLPNPERQTQYGSCMRADVVRLIPEGAIAVNP
jgi:beta-glucanase (GH16 family)